ncbi:MAG: hypothetical protein KAI73_04525 [Rhodospirillaceae bacterium]|nr:hypothetical protein [Rhodospirillaceae bacterium]
MTIQNLGDGNTDGTRLGTSSTEKVAFLGGTPSAQVTLTTLATDATIATTTASVNEIIAELQSKGLLG